MTNKDHSGRGGELGSYGPAGARSNRVHHALGVSVVLALAWLLWLRHTKGVIKIEGA